MSYKTLTYYCLNVKHFVFRFGHPNSSITNQREFERYRSEISRFRSEPSRRLLNAPFYPAARFSFIGRSEEHLQFDKQRRIFREPHNNRQERNRGIMNDPPLHERIQRRSTKTDFDNSRYFRYSVAPSDRSIRRTFSLPISRFSNSESTALLTASNNRDRRIDSRIRDTRNAEFLLHRIRELGRNTDQFRNRRTFSMRTLEADRNQNSNRVRSKNSETSSLAHSLFKSTLFHYFPHNSIPSLELCQINDFVVSTIAGILLYDMMGAMMQVCDNIMLSDSEELLFIIWLNAFLWAFYLYCGRKFLEWKRIKYYKSILVIFSLKGNCGFFHGCICS